jgi:hypothetical protein
MKNENEAAGLWNDEACVKLINKSEWIFLTAVEVLRVHSSLCGRWIGSKGSERFFLIGDALNKHLDHHA